MISIRITILAAALALGSASAAAQSLEISAPQRLHSSASGRALLDLIEGHKAVAVISVASGEAIAGAHELAAAAGRRIEIPADLQFHVVDASPGPGPRLAIATLGDPSEDALRMLHFLRARDARAIAAER